MESDLVQQSQSQPSPISRAFRVPYRMQAIVDRLALMVGARFRRVRFGNLTVQIRRNTWDDRTVRRVIGNREYAPNDTDIKAGDVVIDIGANIGAFSLVAATSAPGVRVFAFEPDRDNCFVATRNAELNGLSGIKVFRNAVAGKPGSLRLFKGEQGALHTIVPGRLTDGAEYEEVEAFTLRQIFDQHGIQRCAFLKLDCEGAEYEILYNTPPDYLARIDQMAIKYHATERKKEKADELARFLEQAGFRIVLIDDHVGGDDGLLRAVRRPG